MTIREEFIQYTIDVFTPFYGRPVSREEAEEITLNSLGLLETLGSDRKCGEINHENQSHNFAV